MRLGSAILCLCLGVTACYSSPVGGDASAGVASSGGATGEGSDSSDTTDAAGSTGAWDPATGGGTDGTSTTDLTATASTGEASAGGSSEGSSGGAPEDCPRVRVVVPPGETLNVRPTPSTAMAAVGTLAKGAIVDVVAFVQGEVLDGNGEWVQIEGMIAGYVWSGLVECTTDEPPKDGFFLPLECGETAKISQGNFGDFSHQGKSAYAFDFAIPLGTPMVATADGTVTHHYAGTKPGDPCYDGGGPECIAEANFVTLLHGDGTTSVYAHLSAVEVAVDEFVPRGTPVGLSGSTGYSTGPHAHFARQEGCGQSHCQSIAVSFADVAGDGVPGTGDSVTSGNCP